MAEQLSASTLREIRRGEQEKGQCCPAGKLGDGEDEQVGIGAVQQTTLAAGVAHKLKDILFVI